MTGAARWMAVASLLFALPALLAACGDSGGGEAASGGGERETRTTTEVVVQTADASGFDAAEVYREAAPGVVTIRSIFDGGGGEGSGFVLDGEGRIVTNAHVVTNGQGGDREEADSVFVEFPDRNVLPAEIVGFDPFADVALLEVDPDNFDLHPLALGDDEKLVVGQQIGRAHV